MEKEGFIRCVDDLLNTDVTIKAISTDRHPSIKKVMRTKEEYQTISHQFDPWHVAKSILKKIMAASKKKSGKKICLIILTNNHSFRTLKL